MTDRQIHKLMVFVRLADELAQLSTCRRAQVGCVVFPRDFSRVYSIGYNGPPSGEPNDSCRDVPGACGCVHGETNALIKHADYSDAVIYCTTSPCPACAGLIVTSRRISRVIYGQHYREPLDAIGMMLRRGIIVRELNKMVTEGW